MPFNIRLVDSFLSATEAAVEEKKLARIAALREAYGADYDAYAQEIEPLADMLSQLSSRPGEVITVTIPADKMGFSIAVVRESNDDRRNNAFHYTCTSAAPHFSSHSIGLQFKTNRMSGTRSPDEKPEDFEGVRRLLSDWLAENLPGRLPELRNIAAKLDDSSMQTDRRIRAQSPLKLKTAGP